MMFGGLLNSPYDILIIPIAMFLLFAVILVRMSVPGRRAISKGADRHG